MCGCICRQVFSVEVGNIEKFHFREEGLGVGSRGFAADESDDFSFAF